MKIKAITHFHSDWSYDGSWSLKKISIFLKNVGYNCVFMTEHDKGFNSEKWLSFQNACKENSSKDFLIVPGIEYADQSNIVHTMTWGDMPFFGEGMDTYELLCEVDKLRGGAVMAHPSRRKAWEKYSEKWAPLLLGIEVWNRKYDGVAPSKDAIAMLHKNSSLVPFLGFDFHRLNQFFPFSVSFEHKGSLLKDEVLASLKEQTISTRFMGLPVGYFKSGFLYHVLKKLEDGRRFIRKMVKGVQP